jgi:hypothetical protein
MKKNILGLLIILMGCSTQIDKRVLGIWNVQSSFYKATYKIEKKGKKIIGKLLYYNDDTTVLHKTNTDKDIFLHDLKYKNDVYVDAISGATKTTSKSLTIKIKHQDTLEITSYIRHQPLIETWTRKQ